MVANWHKIWNGSLVNLEHISHIEIHELQGGGRAEISGTFIGGQTVVLAKTASVEEAQKALDNFLETHQWA